jgi:hypothetical protein
MGKIVLKKLIILSMVGVFSIVIGIFAYTCIWRFDKPVKMIPRVAHAGGGLNGMTYTNSLEALNHNSGKFQLFEIDFSFTADGEIVCIHDWGVSSKITFGMEFDAAPTYDEFNILVAKNNKYTNCNLDTLVQWLRKNPGKRVVTDVKNNNLQALKIIVSKYPGLRDSVIPQIYHAREYVEVKKLGFKDVILTLYRWDAIMPYIILRTFFMDLFAVTIPVERAYYARYFRKLGIPTYVHTINSTEGLDIMRVYGVTEIYTDWLMP